MKISKSLLDAINEAVSQPMKQQSPKGNYIVEGSLEKMSLDQLKAKHAEHHENGGGSDRSYQAMGAIEKHVGQKYGKIDVVIESKDWDEYNRYNNGSYSGGGKYRHSDVPTADRPGADDHDYKPGKKKAAVTKHYHTVPYAKKEDAKNEGMKWDKESKKWYHTDAGKSATSKFKKLTEEEETLDELSKDTLGSYIKKAHKDGEELRVRSDRHDPLSGPEAARKATLLYDKAEKRKEGIHKAVNKLVKEDELDEATWIKVDSHEDYMKHVKANHPDAEHVHHTNMLSQAVVGHRKTAVAHWDDELGTGRVKKSHLSEQEEQIDEETQQGHATEEAARKRMAAIQEKHPGAKHTVMQGRRSGRWHVVRHTTGGMHIVEEIIDEARNGDVHTGHALKEDCGLDSKQDWKSYKTKADKKKTDAIDTEDSKQTAKDNIKEGDESEADYQKYMKERKAKLDAHFAKAAKNVDILKNSLKKSGIKIGKSTMTTVNKDGSLTKKETPGEK